MVIDFTVITAIITVFHLFFWLFFFNSIVLYKKKKAQKTYNQGLTIIICVKDDLSNLKQNISFWLNQSLKNLELLIVDDFSGIETAEFVSEIQQVKGSVSYYKVKVNKPGKKQAIKEALTICRHNWVLFTDADCQADPNWAQSMLQTAITNKSDLVLGYSPYRILKTKKKPKGSLLHRWIHFEAWFTAVQYFSYSIKNQTYMGVGRNLLYNKKAIQDSYFAKHSNLASGDDDLIVQQISTTKNTAINLDAHSFVYTQPASSWKNYINQKRRHMSTATRYKFTHKILLTLFALTQISYYPLLLILLLNSNFIAFGFLYGLKVFCLLLIGRHLISILKAEFNVYQLLIFDMALSFYYLIFAFLIHLFPKKNW